MSIIGKPILLKPSKYQTGAIVSFADGDGHKLKNLTININSIQSGSGTPSPDNVRPISGWMGANIVVSPTLNAGDGTTYAISWQTEAGTVYGGILDVTMGILTVDKVLLSGNYYYSTRTATYDQGRFVYTVGTIKPTTIISSHFSMSAPSGTVGRCSHTANGIYFNAPHNAFADTTNDAVAQWIAENQVQFVSMLETPVTYQLTSVEILSLFGQNNIWADTGDVSVTYQKQSMFYLS